MPVYRAAWVLPVSAPPIRDGVVVLENGRIVEVGSTLRSGLTRLQGTDVRDLGQVALLPGLVNAHVHVELSWMGEESFPEGDFLAWLERVVELRVSEHEPHARAAAAAAIERMVSRGTVACGDVANREWVARELARSPLEGVVFHEVYGPRPADAASIAEGAASRIAAMLAFPEVRAAGERWRILLSPHAAHTASERLLREIAARALPLDPMTIHVAETAAEIEWLSDGTGAFRSFFRDRGALDESRSASGETSVALLDRLGLLSPRTLAVHCVRLNSADRACLRERGVHVVTCPRSNTRLGTGKAPVPELLADGVCMALGTDSLASAPDLDLFAEMAALTASHPALAAEDVLRMATLGGAEALGLAGRLGSIEPGKRDRLAVVGLGEGSADPLVALCSSPTTVHPLERAPWRRMRE